MHPQLARDVCELLESGDILAVALARKLLVALWKYVTAGVLIEELIEPLDAIGLEYGEHGGCRHASGAGTILPVPS